MFEIAISLLLSIAANVISYYICKCLDRKE